MARLMMDRVVLVEGDERLHVGAVESLDQARSGSVVAGAQASGISGAAQTRRPISGAAIEPPGTSCYLPALWEVMAMFETPETKGESSGLGMWVGILVILAVIAGGIVFYIGKKNSGPAEQSTTASAAAAPASTSADAVKDLRVVSKKLDKDYTGTTAVWSVEIRNMSQVYSYSNIQYETTYVGADGSGLGDNHGTIPSLTLDPGDSQTTEFRDTLYPSGTALYNIKITGATASK